MSKISTVKARNQFSDLINRVAYGKERVVLTRRGKPLAAVIPIDDLDLIEEMEDQIDLEEVKKAWAEQGDEPPESWEKVKKELGVD